MASLNCFLHPHHVTIMDHPHTFQSFRHHLDDPYYHHENVDGHNHRGLIAPKFDVYGSQTAYLLNGELPGISDRKDIQITWLTDQTISVRGWTRPDRQPDWEIDQNGTAENSSSKKTVLSNDIPAVTANGTNDAVPVEPKAWLLERRYGQFERSFTFPTNVQHEGVRARLEDGVLRITVQKAPVSVVEQAGLIPVE